MAKTGGVPGYIEDFCHVLSEKQTSITVSYFVAGVPGADSYVGTYEADYENFSGKETLFGGTALERDDGNKIEISCKIDTTSETLKLILLTGADDPEVLCNTESSYSATLELPSASNYIIVEAENFTGSLDLTIE